MRPHRDALPACAARDCASASAIVAATVFGALLAVDTHEGNRILLAGRDRPPSLATMRANAARVEPRLARFGLEPGWLLSRTRILPAVQGVPPLTDQYSPANLLLSE